jgi:hypothetical protein
MQRRTFIAGFGSLAAAGAAAVGTGAFTSVEADRSVSVEVADDSDALLALEPADGPNGEYATTDGGTLAVDLSASNPTSVGGQGVNQNAVTRIERVFAIENQGTQPVAVSLSPYFFSATGSDPAGTALVYVYPEGQSHVVTGGSGGSPGLDPVELGVGEREHYDVFVSAYGADAVGGTVTVSAAATE